MPTGGDPAELKAQNRLDQLIREAAQKGSADGRNPAEVKIMAPAAGSSEATYATGYILSLWEAVDAVTRFFEVRFRADAHHDRAEIDALRLRLHAHRAASRGATATASSLAERIIDVLTGLAIHGRAADDIRAQKVAEATPSWTAAVAAGNSYWKAMVNAYPKVLKTAMKDKKVWVPPKPDWMRPEFEKWYLDLDED